jgi:hypothetical protein
MLGCDDLGDGVAAGAGIGEDERIQYGGSLHLGEFLSQAWFQDKYLKTKSE